MVVWKWRFGGCPLSSFFSVPGINLTLGGYFYFGLGEGVVPGSGPGLVLWVVVEFGVGGRVGGCGGRGG